MPRPLVDLLWRDHAAPPPTRRGPRPRHSVGDLVEQALALADAGGLAAVTVRAIAERLQMTAMSVYTHVNSRDDLLVLMADQAYAEAPRAPFGTAHWPDRVRSVAANNLALLRARPWLLEIDDPRTALGPGTIAKYDHELRAFEQTGLDDLDQDAALTFVLDFTRAAARTLIRSAEAPDFDEIWQESAGPLAGYLGQQYPLAQRIGRTAGEHLGTPYHAEHAWQWGLTRIIAGLATLIDPPPLIEQTPRHTRFRDRCYTTSSTNDTPGG